MNEVTNIFCSNYGQDEDIIKEVERKLNVKKESGYFKGCNNISIYYEKFIVENEKGSIVISHGFTECLEKFTELIYYFTEMGYSVYGLEHRGHGRSSNLNLKEKSQIHIDSFDYYIEDLKIFMDEIVQKKGNSVFLFAHSMGGAIGTLFLEKYQEYFEKAVLSSPMMEINTGSYSENMAYLISKFFIAIGKGKNYIFGQGPFNGEYNLEESATSNKYRYSRHLNALRANEVLQRNGGSFKWINEAIKATRKLKKEENIKKIQIPILLFQSGKDTFVNDEGHNTFRKHAQNCKFVRFDNGKHELYFENDDILEPYLKEIVKFYNEI